MTYPFCSRSRYKCSRFVPVLFRVCSRFVLVLFRIYVNKTWTYAEQNVNRYKLSVKKPSKTTSFRFYRQKSNIISTYCSATWTTYVKKASKRRQNGLVKSKIRQKIVNRSHIVTVVYHIPEQNENKQWICNLNANDSQLPHCSTNKTAMQHRLVQCNMFWKSQKTRLSKWERFAKL